MNERKKRKSLPECIEQMNEAFASIEDAIHDMVGMDCKITVSALDGRVMAQTMPSKPH